MTTIFDDPFEWGYVFEMWEEWASGPDDMELPEINSEESHLRKLVQATAGFLFEAGYEEYTDKLYELDYELSKCMTAGDFRVRLPEIKQVLLEVQAVAQGLNVDGLMPLAEIGKRRTEQLSDFAKRGARDKKEEREQEWGRWRQEAERLIALNPILARNKSELARRIKDNLGLEDAERTIRNRI